MYFFQISVFTISGYTPRSSVVGSSGSSVFRFLMNLCTKLTSQIAFKRNALSPPGADSSCRFQRVLRTNVLPATAQSSGAQLVWGQGKSQGVGVCKARETDFPGGPMVRIPRFHCR